MRTKSGYWAAKRTVIPDETTTLTIPNEADTMTVRNAGETYDVTIQKDGQADTQYYTLKVGGAALVTSVEGGTILKFDGLGGASPIEAIFTG